jgi:predicted phosphate transport protein (TIGR00153 family)
MYLFKKNRELQARVGEYLGLAMQTVEYFEEACDHVLKKGVNEHFEVLCRRCHQEESNADDVRRQIELDMFEKSILPESREDLLGILDLVDRVPGKAESILYMFMNQRTELLPDIRKDMKELVHISVETFRYTVDAARDCFGDMSRIRDFSRLIDNNESLGDRLERKMITRIFAEKMPAGEKLLQKEFVVEAGEICDLCEQAKDRLVIWSVKRQV